METYFCTISTCDKNVDGFLFDEDIIQFGEKIHYYHWSSYM